MANCKASATGIDSNRTKDTHRLGSQAAKVEAATWQTFATAYVAKDGSGYVEVKRGQKTIHRFDFGKEEGGLR